MIILPAEPAVCRLQTDTDKPASIVVAHLFRPDLVWNVSICILGFELLHSVIVRTCILQKACDLYDPGTDRDTTFSYVRRGSCSPCWFRESTCNVVPIAHLYSAIQCSHGFLMVKWTMISHGELFHLLVLVSLILCHLTGMSILYSKSDLMTFCASSNRLRIFVSIVDCKRCGVKCGFLEDFVSSIMHTGWVLFSKPTCYQTLAWIAERSCGRQDPGLCTLNINQGRKTSHTHILVWHLRSLTLEINKIIHVPGAEKRLHTQLKIFL